MKKILLICGLCGLCGLGPGCNTTQQTAAFNTIFTVEQTATSTVDAYYALVIKGTIPTNSVPQVSKAFNELQAACTLAAATAENGTNALAPTQLQAELADLTSLIGSLTPTK